MSRELDAKVATLVMGWSLKEVEWFSLKSMFWSYPEGGTARSVRDFYPTSDANADYEVLKHVRENWSELLRLAFERAVRNIWERRIQTDGRLNHLLSRYEPGDWSRAALKALGEEI